MNIQTRTDLALVHGWVECFCVAAIRDFMNSATADEWQDALLHARKAHTDVEELILGMQKLEQMGRNPHVIFDEAEQLLDLYYLDEHLLLITNELSGELMTSSRIKDRPFHFLILVWILVNSRLATNFKDRLFIPI